MEDSGGANQSAWCSPLHRCIISGPLGAPFYFAPRLIFALTSPPFIHEHRSGPSSAARVERNGLCRDRQVDPRGLVLHSDNGTPMRGNTMVSTLQWLGIVPSFSRPHVSNDNPYSESLFRTLKYTPAYPRLPFADGPAARRWVERFVGWYNGEHRHSAIRFVTPDERH